VVAAGGSGTGASHSASSPATSAARSAARVVVPVRLAGRRDQRADLVVAAQQQGAEGGVEADPPFAQPVEQRLHVVGEGHHPVQAEDAGRALDGVRAAEQRVQQLAVAGASSSRSSSCSIDFDLLLRLADEDRQRGRR
jgi:hypothetical protein